MYYYPEFDQEVRGFLPVQKSGCSRFQGHLLTRQFIQGFTKSGVVTRRALTVSMR